MGKWVVLLVAALAAPHASAQMLYRCPEQGANGATLIQDKPCPDGREAATVLDSREVRVSPQRQRELQAERRRQDHTQAAAAQRRQGSASIRYRAPSEAERRHQACESAKRWRDSQRRRMGLNRNYDTLSMLDRQVRDACRRVGP